MPFPVLQQIIDAKIVRRPSGQTVALGVMLHLTVRAAPQEVLLRRNPQRSFVVYKQNIHRCSANVLGDQIEALTAARNEPVKPSPRRAPNGALAIFHDLSDLAVEFRARAKDLKHRSSGSVLSQQGPR